MGLDLGKLKKKKKKKPGRGGGSKKNIYTGMLKVDFRMLTISIPVYCKKKKKKKTRDHYTSLVWINQPIYTIFTKMMTHYYHFHQQNSPSSYHHRNKGSLGLIYLKQFQKPPHWYTKIDENALQNLWASP